MLKLRRDDLLGPLIISVFAAVALGFAVFLVAPVFISDPARLPAALAARDAVFQTFFAALCTTVASGIVAFFIFSSVPERLKLPVVVFPFLVCALTIAAGLVACLYQFLHAPTFRPMRAVTLAHVSLKESAVEGTGIVTFAAPTARVVEARPGRQFMADKRNVIELHAPISQVFTDDLGSVSDVEATDDILYVIADRDLISVEKQKATRVTTLPESAMRFGRRVVPEGLASELLVFGGGDRGAVYSLRPDGTYFKLMATDARIRGAAGCRGETAVALDEHVLLLRDGFNPRLLFRLPKWSGPITSVAAGLVRPTSTGSGCVWLIATASEVYSVQDGVAALAVAGVGGNLSAPRSTGRAFGLTDPRRNAHFELRFDE